MSCHGRTHITSFFSFAIKCGRRPEETSVPLTRKQREHLKIFEKECMNEFLRQADAAKKSDNANRIRLTQEKVSQRKKSGPTKALTGFTFGSYLGVLVRLCLSSFEAEL